MLAEEKFEMVINGTEVWVCDKDGHIVYCKCEHQHVSEVTKARSDCKVTPSSVSINELPVATVCFTINYSILKQNGASIREEHGEKELRDEQDTQALFL
jgi:hypothetical protein